MIADTGDGAALRNSFSLVETLKRRSHLGESVSIPVPSNWPDRGPLKLLVGCKEMRHLIFSEFSCHRGCARVS